MNAEIIDIATRAKRPLKLGKEPEVVVKKKRPESLPQGPRKKIYRQEHGTGGKPDVKPETGILNEARTALHMRIKDHPRHGLMLDGHPCDTKRLMREYNTWLKLTGQPQYERNPDWIV